MTLKVGEFSVKLKLTTVKEPKVTKFPMLHISLVITDTKRIFETLTILLFLVRKILKNITWIPYYFDSPLDGGIIFALSILPATQKLFIQMFKKYCSGGYDEPSFNRWGK